MFTVQTREVYALTCTNRHPYPSQPEGGEEGGGEDRSPLLYACSYDSPDSPRFTTLSLPCG